MRFLSRNPRYVKTNRQCGAAAIEFALVFTIFFAVFYAIVSYGLVFILLQGFSFAANEGARAAVKVDRLAFGSDAAYIANGVGPVVRARIVEVLDWLPQKAKDEALGMAGDKVVVLLLPSGGIQVEIEYTGYKNNPLIPSLVLPGIGEIPRIPTDLRGESVIGV